MKLLLFFILVFSAFCVEEIGSGGGAAINDAVAATDSVWSSQKITDELSAAGVSIDDLTESLTSVWSSQKITDELSDGIVTGSLSVNSTGKCTWVSGEFQRIGVNVPTASTGAVIHASRAGSGGVLRLQADGAFSDFFQYTSGDLYITCPRDMTLQVDNDDDFNFEDDANHVLVQIYDNADAGSTMFYGSGSNIYLNPRQTNDSYFASGGDLCVGLNITSCNSTVSVSGAGSSTLSFAVHGDAGAANWYAFSDDRAKTSMVSMVLATNIIEQLNPISFKWNQTPITKEQKDISAAVAGGYTPILDENHEAIGLKSYEDSNIKIDKRAHFGFSAQEVKEVIPEAVSVDDNGVHLVNLNHLIAHNTAAIKEILAILKRRETK